MNFQVITGYTGLDHFLARSFLLDITSLPNFSTTRRRIRDRMIHISQKKAQIRIVKFSNRYREDWVVPKMEGGNIYLYLSPAWGRPRTRDNTSCLFF